MNLLQNYLSNSKVKKVLSLKPGQEGFSLIELVVVVAVLAVLSAIAIPSFTDISEKARAAAAANTLSTVVKECMVKIADAGSGKFTPPVQLQGYKDIAKNGGSGNAGFYIKGNRIASSGQQDCVEDGTIMLASEDQAKYPTFSFTYTDSSNLTINSKTCAVTSGSKADGRVCNGTDW
jgi:type IV pilus assembly protein PilA